MCRRARLTAAEEEASLHLVRGKAALEARGQAEEREALSHLSNDAMSAVWGGEMAKTEALVAALREVAEARGEAAREAAKGMVAMRGEVGRVEALLATAEEQRVQEEREGRKERERLEGLIFQARAIPLLRESSHRDVL
ncbi:MAG: hypothetical protein SGPRY_014612 [Prymnesium sp.]